MKLFENKDLYNGRSSVYNNLDYINFQRNKADVQPMQFRKNWSLSFLFIVRSEIYQTINSETAL